jgi:hypothetical protein
MGAGIFPAASEKSRRQNLDNSVPWEKIRGLVSPREIAAAYEQGLLSRQELFLRMLRALAGFAGDDVASELPANLREDFCAWALRFCQDPEARVFGRGAEPVPDAAKREFLRWRGP